MTSAARRRLYLVLLVSWVVLTFGLNSIPRLSVPIHFPYADKAAHFCFYGAMGFLCALWRRACGSSVRRAIVEGALFAAFVGAADEIHQRWIPGRTEDALDWAADVFGGSLGALVSRILSRLFPFLVAE